MKFLCENNHLIHNDWTHFLVSDVGPLLYMDNLADHLDLSYGNYDGGKDICKILVSIDASSFDLAWF